MSWRIILLVVLIGALAAGPAFGLYRSSHSGDTGKVRVVASIYPLADFVRNIGGDRVEVITLIPPGASPHTYEPTPRQIAYVAEAELFVKNGAGLEFWADKVVNASGNPNLVIIDTSVGVLKATEPIEGHAPGECNPHFWLDPTLAKVQVEQIRDGLIQVDPQNEAYYGENAQNYLALLDVLDQELKQEISSFRIKDLVCFHPAWAYFAREYGLNQVAVIEESPGTEPSPRYIRMVIDKVNELELRALFAEPQFNPQAAQAIADDTKAQVIYLDPVGGPGTGYGDTYLKLMAYNLGQMAEAMG